MTLPSRVDAWVCGMADEELSSSSPPSSSTKSAEFYFPELIKASGVQKARSYCSSQNSENSPPKQVHVDLIPVWNPKLLHIFDLPPNIRFVLDIEYAAHNSDHTSLHVLDRPLQ